MPPESLVAVILWTLDITLFIEGPFWRQRPIEQGFNDNDKACWNDLQMTMIDIGIAGVGIGHFTNSEGGTGCTVLRFFEPSIASGEVRGGAPSSREFALLDARRTVACVDAIVLTGGSTFGLAACDGVVRALHRKGVGVQTKHARVPIVIGMALYDLGVASAECWPDADAGRVALERASEARTERGRVGAGTGATVGTWRGGAGRPGGLGVAKVQAGDVIVAAGEGATRRHHQKVSRSHAAATVLAVNAGGDLRNEAESADTLAHVVAGTFEW